MRTSCGLIRGPVAASLGTSSLCALRSSPFPLLSSLLGTEPFVHHPAPLGTKPFSLLSSLFSLFSSLFSLLSSLFSLLSSLFSRCCSTRESANPVAVQFLLQQGSSRFSLRSSLVSPRARPFSLPSRPSGTEPSLFSLLSSLFPLLSLLLFSQIPLRDCHFDLCIRPSTARQTASTLCGSLPGPAECAKRLNNDFLKRIL